MRGARRGGAAPSIGGSGGGASGSGATEGSGGDSAVSAGQRIDFNRERLIFCCTSLVGHRVTAKLRNNIFYEGLFHSCSLDADYSITLKHARQLPSENARSGEVIPTLVIPGKEFLQVSAMDVSPPPTRAPTEASRPSGASATDQSFATDAEIGAKWNKGGAERELVPWTPAAGERQLEAGGLDDAARHRPWDQFKVNEKMYGITSSFNEEMYTTKLDASKIPKEKRDEADRIAREIMSGPSKSDTDDRLEEGMDEEGQNILLILHVLPGASHHYSLLCFRRMSGVEVLRFSANLDEPLPAHIWPELVKKANIPEKRLVVQLPDGRVVARDPDVRFPGALTEAVNSEVALSRDLDQWGAENAGAGNENDSFAMEHRTKRGMITAHSPMRPPMVSEMKRINALNLEPALPKLDDKTRSDWINFKQSQSRTTSKAAHGSGLKTEFEQSLQVIQQRELARKGPQAAHQSAASGSGAGGGTEAKTPMGGESGRSSAKFALNPAAKEFSFNPQASVFMPSPTSGGSQGARMGAMPPAGPAASTGPVAPAGPLLQLGPGNQTGAGAGRALADLLDGLFDRAKAEIPMKSRGEWPQAAAKATGSSFRDVLGRPNPGGPPAMGMLGGGVNPGSMAAMGGPGGTLPASWVQQAPGQQMPPGAGNQGCPQGPQGPCPQMVPQGFMQVPAQMAPGGVPQGQGCQGQGPGPQMQVPQGFLVAAVPQGGQQQQAMYPPQAMYAAGGPRPPPAQAQAQAGGPCGGGQNPAGAGPVPHGAPGPGPCGGPVCGACGGCGPGPQNQQGMAPQQQGGGINFGQAAMGQAGGMMPVGMVPAGPGGPAPKFGAQAPQDQGCGGPGQQAVLMQQGPMGQMQGVFVRQQMPMQMPGPNDGG